MNQRFAQALVRVFQRDILADDADRNFVERIVDALHQHFPWLHVAFGLRQVQQTHDLIVQTFRAQHERNLVDAGDVLGRDDGRFRDVAEQRDLALHVRREITIRAAQQNVGLNSDFEQFLDAVLCGLGLEFAGGGDVRHQRQVDEQAVLAADFLAHLADGFQKRQGFDVADRAADFDDRDVRPFPQRDGRRP